MKKIIKSISVITFLFFLIQNIKSQNCIVSNTENQNGTMGKRTDKAVFIGQSFTACKSGKLTKVLFRIGGGNEIKNAELRIFEMKKIAKKPIYKQAIQLPTPGVPIKNFKDITFTLNKNSINLVEGKTYTIGLFKPKTNQKKLFRFKSDNKNTYKKGSLVSNFKIPGGKKQNKSVDMVFSVTIE